MSGLFRSPIRLFRASRTRVHLPGLGLLVLSLTAGGASGSPSGAAQQIDCDAVNVGVLNVEIAGTERKTRTITLKAGESLDFTFVSDAGPLGSLALVAGPGSPSRLLAGPPGTTATFVAPAPGIYRFELAAGGDTGATFTATCTSSQMAQQSETTGAPSTTSNFLAEFPMLDMLPPPEDPAYRIDPETWQFVQDEAKAEPGTPRAKLDPAALAAVRRNGVNVWLGANGERISLTAPAKPSPKADANALSGGGLNYEVLPQIMVGALVQLDPQGSHIDHGPPSLLDRGWMAGPMTSVRLAPGISLDARAAWGESQPAITHLSAGGPGAERHQVNARLANTQAFGRWRFSSTMAVDYLEVRRHSAGPATDDTLAPRAVGSGHVNIRPELSYRLDVDGSTFIEPKAAISSLWDIESLSALAPTDDLRLKAEAGITFGTSTGTTLQATGALQEGAGDATDVWSGRLQLKVPLK